jgi:hypothetical protein
MRCHSGEAPVHFRGKVGKNKVNGKDTEGGPFEVGFACVHKHQGFLGMPLCGSHELGGKILHGNGDLVPTGFLQHIADFIFTGLSTTQRGLDSDKSVGSRQPDHPQVVAEQIVLEFEPPQIFHRLCGSDAEHTPGVQHRSPAVRVLMLFHPTATKTDAMLRAFHIEPARPGEGGKNPGTYNGLPLDFCDGVAAFLTVRSSAGVWAKNSARDITGRDAFDLAELIRSASFRWDSVLVAIGIQGSRRLDVVEPFSILKLIRVEH